MGKLNQVIAIESGIKARAKTDMTTALHAAQRGDLFLGFSKTFKPLDEAGERLPPEKKNVQITVREVLRVTRRASTDVMDVTARKEWSNCVANADVVVDGVTVLNAVPVTYLLFLEKHVTDLHTVVKALPILDDADIWEEDENSGLYKTAEVETNRTKKVQKPLVLIAPTEKHPGQAQIITEDVIVGNWLTTKLSGAMPKPKKEALLERMEKFIRAVKEAREKANDRDEAPVDAIGRLVSDHLFAEVSD